jgi:hypothetical protein
MTSVHLRGIACAAAMLWAHGTASPARAQIGIGIWVRMAGPASSLLTMRRRRSNSWKSGSARVTESFGGKGPTAALANEGARVKKKKVKRVGK